jgi:hypothetical protein
MLPPVVRNHLLVSRPYTDSCIWLKQIHTHTYLIEISSEEDNLALMDITPKTLPGRYENFLMYQDFVSFYVSPVIGLRRFEKDKCSQLYSRYATVSDEAFAVLTLENNWDRWMSMAVAKHWKDSAVRTKYTVTRDKPESGNGGSKKKRKKNDKTPHPATTESEEPEAQEPEAAPQARRYRGWSAHGINRYNQLFDQIEKERATPRGKQFEERLLAFYREKAEADTKQRKVNKVPAPSLPMPRHQLWSTATVTATVADKAKKSDQSSSSGDSSDDDDDEEDSNQD